jgi:ABC-type transport system substrate-binding protein
MTSDSRAKTLYIVAIIFLFVLSGCISISTDSSAADPKIFTMGLGEPVTSANPFVGIYSSDYLFYSYIYDYLMFPNEDGVATPNLASSWWFMNGTMAAAMGSDFSTLTHNNTPSDWPLGSIWEYNLTQSVYWNDGEPFTADDVVFTIRIQTGAGYINYWAYQPYTKWMDRCEKINDYKVRIFFADHSTKSPVQIAWGNCLSIPIMPKHIFGAYPDAYIAQNWTGIPAIGTGPFKGTSSLPNEIIAQESITLEKNPYYDFTESSVRKGLGGVYARTNEIDKLVMKFYSEEQALVLGIKTGILDVCEVNAFNYIALKNDPNKPPELTLVSIYSPTVYSKISHFNVWKGASASLNPTRLDPALLRATAIATNKSYICDSIFGGLATPGVGILSPVWPQYYWNPPHNVLSTFNVTDGSGNIIWSYTKPMDDAMAFNLTLANQILDQAGYVWTDASHTQRKVGALAADRLVNLGIIGDPSTALNKLLDFEDVYEIEVFEDKEISEYLTNEWAHIGVKITQKPVNVGVWNQLVYGFQYLFTESYWSGDVDPNYLMYVMTSYAMDGWNEFGTVDATYDHYYDMQASTTNFTERKYWMDKCQEWQYLAGGAMIYTAYPKTCFAYNDGLRWSNWGNWSTHPGLAIDHCWGETPLFYHLTYGGSAAVDTIPPVTSISLSGSSGTMGWYLSPVNVTLSASDGSGLNWTKYRLDGGSWQTYSSNVTISTDGSHVLEYYSQDTVGNTEMVKNADIRIDRAAPVSNATVSGTNVTINSSDASSGVKIIRYVIDNGTWNDYNDTFAVSTAGNHTIKFYSSDNAGNIEDIRSVWVNNSNGGDNDGSDANTQGLLLELIAIGVIVAIAVIAISIFAYTRYRKKSKNGGGSPPPPSD